MIKTFSRYASVGVINTLLHWASFYLAYLWLDSQSLSNLIAFTIAVTFSFFVNARWTFRSQATARRYIIFVVFMGALSWSIGEFADTIHLPPLLTLISFSALSLVLGFLYSRYCVFRSPS